MSKERKQSTEAAVREIRRKTRRKFAPEEKIRIVLEGPRGEQSISERKRMLQKIDRSNPEKWVGSSRFRGSEGCIIATRANSEVLPRLDLA